MSGRRAGRALAAATALLLAACVGSASTTHGAAHPASEALREEAALQSERLVDLTVYFRVPGADEPHLVPVVREVPVSDDLPRQALELLLAGPTPADGADLVAPLPTTTEIRSFAVRDGVAEVDLSSEVITDAASVGANAACEALALAALANTLTEFPWIARVDVTVEGASSGVVDGVDVDAFWGWWGLPAMVERDESVVGGAAAWDPVPDVTAFTRNEQRIGTAHAGPVTVSRVRTHPRATYLRVSLELADVGDRSLPADRVPPVRARAVGDAIVLEVSGVTTSDASVREGHESVIADPAFAEIRVEPGDEGDALRVLVRPRAPAAFWLHALTDPARIVLDVRK